MISITNMLTNHMENPLGFWLGKTPRLSWVIETDLKGDGVVGSRVELAEDENFSRIIFDSGIRNDVDNICYPLPADAYLPRTRYHWRVSVEIEGEKGQSGDAWFETGKLEEGWDAEWISPVFSDDWHPVLYSDISVPKRVKAARIYICGLGLYELFINGSKTGDERLSPGLCAYDKWLPYQSFDITGQIREGSNHVEVFLGNGWYKGRYGLNRNIRFRYGEEFACVAEIRLTYEDGSEEAFVTNADTWRARRSVILSGGIFDGESRDDTLSNAEEYPVKIQKNIKAPLEARRSPGIRIMGRIKPAALIKTPAGESVLDMGQNMVGWLEFKSHLPKGEEIHLQFGEVLQDGNFYRDNLRTALAEYRYKSDGKEKTVSPLFTFFGFRYVKLTKWSGGIDLEDFTGLVLHSDLKATGRIETGNPKVNRLFENVLWSQRGNYLDIPTDCPQRDERMGWMGDAQVFFGTAAFNMDVAGFFSKFCYDMLLEQRALNGDVPVVIPKHDVTQTGACAWGDGAAIIPWNLYIRYGDSQLLAFQYENMKGWVDFLRRHDEETGNTRLWRGSFHYGDWLSLDNEDPIGNRFGGTEHTYLASCFYFYSVTLTAKAARVLNRKEDEDRYTQLAGEIRSAILREYCSPSGRLAVTTQTAYVLALYMEILPPEWRERNAYALRMKLKETNYHLRTGFIGTPYLCRVLSETGSNDIAYRILLQEDFPSWLYEINMGATTIWERWNSLLPDGSISDTGMNSLNHYSYGSIVEWLYRNAAGINPLEDSPGFRRFRLTPQPSETLGKIKAEFASPLGLIKSFWTYLESGELELGFTVPFGAVAECVLPYTGDNSVRELSAGEYSFRYFPNNRDRRLTMDTPLSEIYRYPAAVAVLRECYPEFSGMMLFPMLAGERSINDFIREGFLSLSKEDGESLSEKLTAAMRH
jgi:alpha-L-rhamnosidase